MALAERVEDYCGRTVIMEHEIITLTTNVEVCNAPGAGLCC